MDDSDLNFIEKSKKLYRSTGISDSRIEEHWQNLKYKLGEQEKRLPPPLFFQKWPEKFIWAGGFSAVLILMLIGVTFAQKSSESSPLFKAWSDKAVNLFSHPIPSSSPKKQAETIVKITPKKVEPTQPKSPNNNESENQNESSSSAEKKKSFLGEYINQIRETLGLNKPNEQEDEKKRQEEIKKKEEESEHEEEKRQEESREPEDGN